MRVEGISRPTPIHEIDSYNLHREEGPKEIGENKKASDENPASQGNQSDGELSIGEQKLIEAIEKANKALRGIDKRFEFSIHEGTKKIMVKVINDETDEVIREIPPEKVLDLVAKIWELVGILIDEKI